MTETEKIIRATEIVMALAMPLVRDLAGLLDGTNEKEATRQVLERLAAREDLAAVLPKVRAMLANAKRSTADLERERDERADEPTTEIAVPSGSK